MPAVDNLRSAPSSLYDNKWLIVNKMITDKNE